MDKEEVKKLARLTQHMFTVKKTKEPTHFDGLHYPLRTMDDIGPLLRERLSIIRQKFDEKFGPGVRIWLFGSQLRGRGGSGKPDIDLHVFRPDLNQSITIPRFAEIVEEIDFKVDFNVCDIEKSLSHLDFSKLNRVPYIEVP